MQTTDHAREATRLSAQARAREAAAEHYRLRSLAYYEAMKANPPKGTADILPPGWSNAEGRTLEQQARRDARHRDPEAAVGLADSYDDHLDGCEPIDPPLLGGRCVMTPRQIEKHARRAAAEMARPGREV